MIAVNPFTDNSGKQASLYSDAVSSPALDESHTNAQVIFAQSLQTTADGNLKLTNHSRETEQSLLRALNNLQSDLVTGKSLAHRIVDRGRSMVAWGNTQYRLRARTQVNQYCDLLNESDTLETVLKLAKSNDMPPSVQNKARDVVRSWLHSSKLGNAPINNDTVPHTGNNQHSQNTTEAIEKILTGENEAERLRGISDLLKIVSSKGKKEDSLAKYLDRIQESFGNTGAALSSILEDQISYSFNKLVDYNTEDQQLLLEQDPTLLHDFNSAVADIAFGHIKKNNIAQSLHQLISSEFGTSQYEESLESIHNIISDFSKNYSHFKNLEKKYEQAYTELESLEGSIGLIPIEFLTDQQLDAELNKLDVRFTRLRGRSNKIKNLKTGLGSDKAGVVVSRSNIDIAFKLKEDAKTKAEKLKEKFEKTTKPIEESLQVIPELRDVLKQIIGPRYGMSVKNTEEYFNIFGEEREHLEKETRANINKEIEQLNNEVQSAEHSLYSLVQDTETSRNNLLFFLGTNTGINIHNNSDAISKINAWIQGLHSHTNIRKNPHSDSLLEVLHKTKNDIETNNVSEECSLVLSKNILSFLHHEYRLDTKQGKTIGSSFLEHSPDIHLSLTVEELLQHNNAAIQYNASLQDQERLETQIDSLNEKIKQLSSPETRDEEIKVRLEKKVRDKIEQSFEALTALGIIHDSNLEEAVSELNDTALFVSNNSENYDSDNFGEVLLRVLNSFVRTLMNNFGLAPKQGATYEQ